MQSLQSTAGSATGSRAGSVKSFGFNTGASQNSDVMAHVDPDECGGSLMGSIMDWQSIHSQEDIRSGTENELHDHHRGPISKDDDILPIMTHPAPKQSTLVICPVDLIPPSARIGIPCLRANLAT